MQSLDVREIRHFHLFCGLGGGGRGFNRANPRVGNMVGRFRCIGGIDVDPASVRDFQRLTGTPGSLLDLFSREQFTAFHGMEPPEGWREATPRDIQLAAGFERPHIVFLSAPCKGFSGLLSESKSQSAKYQALNGLTLRGVWLMLEAFADDPPELIIFENVPRIAVRGRALLDRIGALLRKHCYSVAETTHDCGEIGGLAQSRKRFLLVARHMEKVPPFLYQPPKRSLRGVGEVLEKLPLPGDGRGGPMHRIPALQWQTWVRLAFVEAGSDWRSLNKLRVQDGMLADYAIVPELHRGSYGVTAWDEPADTVRGRSGPSNGAFSMADPRHVGPAKHNNEFRIARWDQTASAVTGAHGTGQCVADPRPANHRTFDNIYRVVRWEQPSKTVIGKCQPSDGAISVADPRIALRSAGMGVIPWDRHMGAVAGESFPTNGAYAVADPRAPSSFGGAGKYPVTGWSEPSSTVIASSTTGHGAFAVSDPRCGMNERGAGSAYLTGGHYGVVPWGEAAGAVSASACHDNGRWSVADPRLPEKTDRLVCVIRALDDTWHRPFTTLELAALQSLIDPEEAIAFDGESDQAWRERIGNAVPSDAATAIAETMGRTLLLAWSGEGFMLASTPVWVRPVAVALSVKQPNLETA